MDLETLYRTYQSLLLAVSYRILGSYSEAEDALQDIFITLREVDLTTITYPKAYLVKMITNHSINQLQSARHKRELYTGTWLPEPVVSINSDAPSEYAIQQENFGYALLVLMEKLTPLERAVFVLRESLGYEYEEIAEILNKSEAACRKIFSRAKAKLDPNFIPKASPQDAERFVHAFAKAVTSGEFKPFINLLTEDSVLLSDGGGKIRAAIFPIKGKDRVAAFFEGIGSKGSLDGEVQIVTVSGQVGVLITRKDLPPKVICFQPNSEGNQIQSVYLIVNPEKLTHIGSSI
ncbi:RNA polymerase sigma factor SigJ [Paenibacillus sp. N1-5-1-14]|uniref:RNA polymerase sigma factor SigJ n=1 Tax=Paenibacillus radicibacter TaxID=2972488 RepID=UPI002158B9DE|nr:RNA polymerase sigma factor SigJ [Paenibacillus radicibacter]MCR8643421.1 RNA polymerase sigma factor SigJ [Paenibacillus radicibacter]